MGAFLFSAANSSGGWTIRTRRRNSIHGIAIESRTICLTPDHGAPKRLPQSGHHPHRHLVFLGERRARRDGHDRRGGRVVWGVWSARGVGWPESTYRRARCDGSRGSCPARLPPRPCPRGRACPRRLREEPCRLAAAFPRRLSRSVGRMAWRRPPHPGSRRPRKRSSPSGRP